MLFKMKNLLSKNYLMIKGLALMVLVVMGGSVMGQSYLGLDGGLEGLATIDNSTSVSTAALGKWTKNNASTTLADETSVVRSGGHSLKITCSITSGRRVWSPLFTQSSTTSSTTIQFYKRSANNTTNYQESMLGVGDGTTYDLSSSTYAGVSNVNTWEKVTYTRPSWTFTDISGVITTRLIGTGTLYVYADDIAVYAGAVDNTAPNAPSSMTVAQNSISPTTKLDLTWGAASGGIDGGGYMVVRYATAPVAADDPNVNGIYSATNTYTVTTAGTVVYQGTATTYTDDNATAGLSPNTTYYYKVYTYDKAYNYSGEFANTGTSGVTAIPTYTWNVSSGNWATAASWTPSRTSPNTNDILIFDGNTQATPTVTVDFTTSQSIGQIKLQNNANVTLNTDDNRTLNIGAGISGSDLDIPAGSTLNLQSTAAIAGLTVNVVTGNKGSISGTVNTATSVSADQTHQLKAADASGITFNSGGSFTAGLQSFIINNPFGSTGTAGSIIFANGSTFTQFAGTNPFALTVPASIVTFNPSSTYVYKSTGNDSPPFDSRTYGNFEFDATANGTISSGSGTIAGNLIITSGTFSLAGTSSFSVAGNITIASGATLNYSPSSVRSITLNGSTLKTISGSGTLTLGSNACISVVNTVGVTFSKNITIGTAGTFTLPASGSGVYTFSAGNIFTHSNATASSCNFNGRSITLKSDATGTAAFGTFASTALNATNITVERYIPATRRAYRFLAAPVTTTGGVYASWQESGTNAAGLGIQVSGIAGASPGGVDATTGLDITTNGGTSMFSYNGSAWLPVTNTKTTQLTPGAGFRVLVRGDRLSDLYASINPSPTATTIKATGTVGQGTITLTNLVAGFNLLGNPYPSAIDWNATGWGAARNATNVYDAIYIYDPALTASTSSMTYPTYLNGVGTNGGSNIIRSGQAFFVEAAASASISFLEAYKSTTVTGGFFRSATPEMMRVNYMQNNEHLDDIIINFNNDAQVDFDSRFDAISMGGDANGLASFKNAERLAIHTRPTAVGDDSVALSVRNTTTGNYQLKFSEMEGFAASTEITLLDKFLNVQYDVKQDSIVAFEITTDVNSKGDDRFWLFYNHKSTGVNQQALVKNKINVYPNPASSVINLSLKLAANQKSTYSFNIYNQLGAMVQSGVVDFADDKQAQVNIDAFSAGVYFITASNGKDLQTIKFVK